MLYQLELIKQYLGTSVKYCVLLYYLIFAQTLQKSAPLAQYTWTTRARFFGGNLIKMGVRYGSYMIFAVIFATYFMACTLFRSSFLFFLILDISKPFSFSKNVKYSPCLFYLHLMSVSYVDLQPRLIAWIQFMRKSLLSFP